MPRGLPYKHVRKAGPLLAGELNAGEIGVDTTNGYLYFSTDGASVVKHRPLTDAEFALLAGAIQSSEKGAANGVATLDGAGKVPSSQLPPLSLTDVSVVGSQAAQLALTAQEGDVAVRTDQQGEAYVHNGGSTGTMADWTSISGPAGSAGVTTFNGRTGTVSPQAGDYTSTQISDASTIGGQNLTESLDFIVDSLAAKAEVVHSHSAADIASGDLAAARFQANLVAALNAASGTVSNPNIVLDGGTL